MSDETATPNPSVPPVASEIDREHPWPGLRTYDESMHAYFFGRASEVDELLRLVRRDSVALFYGQSGLGKSSVLQAGLFPKLRVAEMLPVHIRLRYTSEFPHPVEQVLHEVVAAAHAAGGEAPAGAPGCSLFEYFYDERHEFWSARNRVLTPVLVFDQFEEIFTLGGRDAASQQRREELLQELADLAAHRPPGGLVRRFEESPELAARFSTDRTRCRMLFSMREDFLPELGNLRQHLPTLPSGGLRLQRLTGTQAQEVLERPGGHLLGEGVTERIIRFVAAEKAGAAGDLAKLDVEPALLSVVASELNFRRKQRGLERISADLVQGARDEILTDFYERALAGLDDRVREFIEEQLLTTTGFRDSIAVEDAEASFGVSRDVIAQLVDRRLLRIDERFQLQRVELTHDLLTAVVKSSRDRRRERQAAAAAQRRAEDDKRTAQAAAAQAQAKLKRTRVRAAVTGAMVLLALGVVVPTILLRRASKARDDATKAENLATVRFKEANAANQLAETRLEEAKQALSRYIIVQAKEHLARGDYNAARLVLTLADRGEAKMQLFPPAQLGLLSAALDEPPVLRLEGVVKLSPGVRQVVFAPRGRLLVVEAGGALQFVTAAAGNPGAALNPEPVPGELASSAGIMAVDLEWTDSGRLAVATETADVSIFDLSSGRSIAKLEVPRLATKTQTEAATTTGAEGTKNVVADKGAAARPADSGGTAPAPETGKVATSASMSGQRSAYAVCVRFSPDGTKLAAAIADGRVIVWQRAAADWTGTPTTWWTSNTGAASEDLSRTETEINWLLDGTIVVTHGAGGAWLTAPGEKWESAEPLERISAPGVRQAVAPSENQLDSDVFLSRGAETRVVWNRYVASAGPEGHAAIVRANTTLPDRILAHAVIDERRLLLTAMRDGTITLHRLVPAAEGQHREDVLEITQTVTGPKSHQIDLTVRPDGRVVAATADDGRVFLYHVEPEPVGREKNATAFRRFIHSPDGWWQFTDQGAVIAPDGSVATDILDITSAAAQPVTLHSICRPDGANENALAFVSVGDVDPETGGRPLGVWSFATKSWRWKKSEQAFGLQRASDIARFEDAIQFSPDGRAVLIVCRAESAVHVVAADDGHALTAPIRLPGDQKVQRVAWSGDGHRIAVVTDDLQILIVDRKAAEAGKPPIVASVPARSFELSALALDQTGAVLGYVTPDNRLVLDFIEQNDELPSLIAPLSGQHATGLAFAPDASGIIVFSPSGLSVRQAQSLASEHIERIEWLNQRTRQGFRFVPYPAGRPTDLRDLNVAVWLDDTGNRAVAEFQHAWTSIVVDWFAWVDAARTVVTQDPTPALENARVTEMLADGLALVERIEDLSQGRPAVLALLLRIAPTVNEPLALYDFFGITPLWTQIASYLQEGYVLTTVSPRQAAELFPRMVERLKSEDTIGDSEYALMKRVVEVLAAAGTGGTLLSDERAALRSDKLFSPEEWDPMIFASPDNELRAAEAAALFDAADYEGSIRYYGDLERRDPNSLRYTTLNAQNYRFRHEWATALARYQDVLTRARVQGQIDFAGEAAVCSGWCLQGLGRAEEADAAMLLGVEIAPENTWVLQYASTYFIDRNQPERVGEWTERLVNLADLPAHRVVRARFLTATLDYAAARIELNTATASADTPPDIYYAAGELIAYLGTKSDKETGATWLLEAYNKTTDRNLEYRALGQLGTTWTHLNNYTGVLSAYRLRLENYTLDDAERLDAHLNSAWMQTLTRDFDAARQSLDQALALDASLGDQPGRDRSSVPWVAGIYHEATGNTNAAIAAYARSAELDGPSGHLSYARVLHRHHRLAEAQRAVERGLGLHPGDADLRLFRAELLLTSNPAAAQSELEALDDSASPMVAVRAAALLGQAAAAADRYAATLDNPFAEASLELAGLHAMAWRQTGDDTQRLQALSALANALWERHRGNIALRYEFGLDALRDEPVFALAAKAINAPFNSPESLLALARVEVRVAALLPEGPERTRHEERARGWLSYGIDGEMLAAAEVRADAELAPFAPAEPAAEPEPPAEAPQEQNSGRNNPPGASHDETE